MSYYNKNLPKKIPIKTPMSTATNSKICRLNKTRKWDISNGTGNESFWKIITENAAKEETKKTLQHIQFLPPQPWTGSESSRKETKISPAKIPKNAAKAEKTTKTPRSMLM